MGKEIIVSEIKLFREFRTPTALFTVSFKNFTRVDFKAFMDAEDIFKVMAHNPDVKLLFINEDLKASLYSQLSASDKILFGKLE
jgi:hypothetical protein